MFIPFFLDVTACLNTMLRIGAVFTWMEQHDNEFNLLKSELVKMPRLQYPNPNKPFKLFTDASKHSYSGILHQEETSDWPGAEVNLIPIAYFQAPLIGSNNCGTPPKRTLTQFTNPFKICILLSRYKMYAVLWPQTTGSILHHRHVQSSASFNIKFQHIQGKKNMVANAISKLRTLGPYQDNDNEDVPPTLEDVIENIIEEVYSTDVVLRTLAYNVGKHNLDVLRKEQWWDRFCNTKVKEMKKKPDPNFLLDDNSILRKVVKLKYTVELTIVVLRNKHLSLL